MSLSPLAQRIYRTLVRQLGLPNPLIAYGDLVRALGALPPPDTNLKPNDQRVIILGGCSRRNELSMRPRSFVCGSGNITDAVETLASTGYQDRFLSHFGRIELVRPGLYERLLARELQRELDRLADARLYLPSPVDPDDAHRVVAEC